MDETAFAHRATIQFPAAGVVLGEGPCNSFSGRQTLPYPWLSIENIVSTRRACPDLSVESEYFMALGQMTLAEVAGDTLILSTAEGREMVFTAR